jgi:SpoIID/LytB domain protein
MLCTALALYGNGVWGGSGTAAAVTATGTSFTFAGSGWGHGVGMSQWGARGMAANGSDFRQILSHYYAGIETGPRTVNNDLRVLVAQNASTLTVVTGGSTTFQGVGTVGAGVTVTLSRSGSQIRLTGGLTATVDAPVRIQYAGAGDLRLTPPGHSYRYGQLAVRTDGSTALRAVIENLSMQHYLYGLAEMPASWPAEALKAQATAGRTFAQRRIALRSPSADFDLYSTVTHQAYTGTRSQDPRWVAAVDATANQVITYNGSLIDAVYSASSGGHTENSEYVWVSSVPYLRGRADPHDVGGGNPHSSWSRTYTGEQLGSWFGIGTVTSVSILAPVGVSGRVDKATIRLAGTGGSRDLTGAAFRSAVNNRSPSAALMSTKFTVSAQGTATTTGGPPTGNYHTAMAQGRTILIGGTASDPDGVPVVRVVSTMGTQRAVRETRPTGGSFLVSWDGAPGTRRVCVSVLDVPTGQEVSLGCRDVVVK